MQVFLTIFTLTCFASHTRTVRLSETITDSLSRFVGNLEMNPVRKPHPMRDHFMTAEKVVLHRRTIVFLDQMEAVTITHQNESHL